MRTDVPRQVPDLEHSESLLERLAYSAIDDDYPDEQDGPPHLGVRMLTGVVLGLLGLVLATAVLEAQDRKPSEDLEREALIESIGDRQVSLAERRSRVVELETEIDALSSAKGVVSKPQERDAMLSGRSAVTGQGIRIALESAPGDKGGGTVSDTDLQLVVNGLWVAGAEAIDVGGQRVTSTTAIRSAGGGVTVNFTSLTEPFVVRAIGNADKLAERFSVGPSGRYLVQRETVAGISWKLETQEMIKMRGAPEQRLRLRQAKALPRGKE